MVGMLVGAGLKPAPYKRHDGRVLSSLIWGTLTPYAIPLPLQGRERD
jgi:hypothetical protein